MEFKAINTVLTIFSPNLPEVSETPWIPLKARMWLDSFLKKDMMVFEYGSGGSTIFMANQVSKIVSVEYELSWFLAIKKIFWKKKIKNCKLYLVRPEPRTDENSDYVSSDFRYDHISFKKYVQTIDRYPNEYFDLVFVDGRARNSCIVNAIPKVKNGGYILLDDSERIGYIPAVRKLDRYWKRKFISTDQDVHKEATIWKIRSN